LIAPDNPLQQTAAAMAGSGPMDKLPELYERWVHPLYMRLLHGNFRGRLLAVELSPERKQMISDFRRCLAEVDPAGGHEDGFRNSDAEGAVDGTTIYDLHGRLVRDTFGHRLSDQDAFLIFVLFHCYKVVLSEPVLSDRPGVQVVAAQTQRGVAEALASVWIGTQDERADLYFWYYRWNGGWGSYGHAERLSPAESERLEQLKAELERHPFVSRLEPED
jgi:hypothetical protein